MSDSNQLVKMANDIGNFFRPQPRGEAVAGIANHIRSFWTKRMIEKLSARPDGLDELPLAALRSLVKSVPSEDGTVEHVSGKPTQTHGGDAG